MDLTETTVSEIHSVEAALSSVRLVIRSHTHITGQQIDVVLRGIGEDLPHRIQARPALEEDAGYEAIRVDRQEFLGDIVFELIARIKESRFVVADVTEHPTVLRRNGVKREASRPCRVWRILNGTKVVSGMSRASRCSPTSPTWWWRSPVETEPPTWFSLPKRCRVRPSLQGGRTNIDDRREPCGPGAFHREHQRQNHGRHGGIERHRSRHGQGRSPKECEVGSSGSKPDQTG